MALLRAPSKRTQRRGYTAVEVMMSIALLGVGAAGVMSMQKTSIRANLQARRLDVANALARTWIERLRVDATAWTLPSPSQQNGNNITNAKLLVNGSTPLVDTGRATADDGWYLPDQRLSAPSGGAVVSPAFDILGRDVALASDDRFFCTHVRLDCLVPTLSSGVATSCSLMRASVRVFWPKDGAQTVADYCNAGNVAAIQNAVGSPYHFIYAVSAIRQNVAP